MNANLFTGLVEEMGTVQQVQRVGQGRRLSIAAPLVASDVAIGDSVAVNGVCLTVVQANARTLTVDVVPESVRRSTLASLHQGTLVNLERAMRADARLGGHIVAGHVDGIGEVIRMNRKDNALLVTVKAEPELQRYIVSKGSIAIDGISLTVMDASHSSFRVSIIPHTAAMTTLHIARVGTKVNLEVDQLGKYAENLLAGRNPAQSGNGLSAAKLREWGY